MKPIIILTLTILLFSYAVNAEDISAPTDVGKTSITLFSNKLLLVIIPAVITVILQIIIWILIRSDRIGKIDYMLKRLELVSKIDEVKQKHGSTDNPKHDWNVLEEESSDALSFILVNIKKQREKTKKKIHISKFSWIKYVLLWYRPASGVGWTFRCLYYCMLFGVIGLIITLLLDTVGLSYAYDDYIVFILVLLSYGVLAFIFHFFAIQNYKSYLVNGKILRGETKKETDISKLHWVKYILLWYNPASGAGRTLHCMYYYMLFSGSLLLANTIGLIKTGDLSKEESGIFVLMAGGLAFLFHFLAMRNYKRCFANLEFLKEEIKKEIDISGLSRIKYALLLYRPASPAGWTFHCLYYSMLLEEIICVCALVIIGFGLPIFSPGDSSKDYGVLIVCFLFNGGLAFLFHFLSIRTYKNYFTKIKSKVKSME